MCSNTHRGKELIKALANSYIRRNCNLVNLYLPITVCLFTFFNCLFEKLFLGKHVSNWFQYFHLKKIS